MASMPVRWAPSAPERATSSPLSSTSRAAPCVLHQRTEGLDAVDLAALIAIGKAQQNAGDVARLKRGRERQREGLGVVDRGRNQIKTRLRARLGIFRALGHGPQMIARFGRKIDVRYGQVGTISAPKKKRRAERARRSLYFLGKPVLLRHSDVRQLTPASSASPAWGSGPCPSAPRSPSAPRAAPRRSGTSASRSGTAFRSMPCHSKRETHGQIAMSAIE